MSTQQYHNHAINDISRAIQEIFTVLALTVNCMLLRIVFTSERRDIGSYRYLIATFAVSDLLYTSIHWLVYPIPEMYGNSYMISGHNILTSRIGPCIYGTIYSQAVPILTFHFLYRTFSIRNPEYLSRPFRFFGALLITTIIIDLDGFIVNWVLFRPDEETLAKNAPFFSGNVSTPVVHRIETARDHVQALFWSGKTFEKPRWLNLLGALNMFVVIGVTYIIVIVCSHLINEYLKEHAKSIRTVSLHRQLFRSLVCQAIYPLITTYFPLAVSVFSPIFGLNFDWVPVISPTMCVSHPLFDPLILIFCMSEYRTRFLQWIGMGSCVQRSSQEEYSRRKSTAVSNGPVLLMKQRRYSFPA